MTHIRLWLLLPICGIMSSVNKGSCGPELPPSGILNCQQSDNNACSIYSCKKGTCNTPQAMNTPSSNQTVMMPTMIMCSFIWSEACTQKLNITSQFATKILKILPTNIVHNWKVDRYSNQNKTDYQLCTLNILSLSEVRMCLTLYL